MAYELELSFAQKLAVDAGKIMREYFRSDAIGTEWKTDNTPLTIADTAINNLVIERVKDTFPKHGVIGEEASYEPDRDFVWVVDPIDGTMPFSLGIPTSTFSLALVDRSNGQPVVAVVYEHHLKLLYQASRKQGVFLNGKKIQTSAATDLKQNYVFLWHGNHQDRTYFDKNKYLDSVTRQGGRYFVVPSFVYFASKVASGEFVGAVLDYGSPWDSAAVALLTQEAGGIVTDLDGKERRFDEFGSGCMVAANQPILDTLIQTLREAQL